MYDTVLRNKRRPKMFCLITPQFKEEVICFLLYLKSLWNVVLDFDIHIEFWFRKTKIKVDTHEIPFLIYQILLQYFRLSRTCCFCVKNISKTFLKLAVPELADISIKHVSRVLCEELVLKSCVAAKKPLINDANKKKKLIK